MITEILTQPITVTLTISQLIAVLIIMIIGTLIIIKKNKKQPAVKREASKNNQETAKQNELKFQETLKLFLNTCEIKFNYWFEKNILPVYMTKGVEHVTASLVEKTYKTFLNDMKVCLHPKIYDILLKNYFSDPRSVDIFLIQYFYNKINAYELKNKKTVFNNSALNNL